MLKSPVFLTNFKQYETAVGTAAVELAQMHEEVAAATGATIGVCVNAIDLQRVAQAVNIPVFAQHIDPIDWGKGTGAILPQAVKRAGAVGTLLNHSERRLDPDTLDAATACAQKSSLIRILCAKNEDEVATLAQLGPDYIALEPPELIGSLSASVARSKPDSIARSVAASGGIPLLVGAGISTPEDIQISLDLGAQGFLVATAVVKAPDPRKILTELVSVFAPNRFTGQS